MRAMGCPEGAITVAWFSEPFQNREAFRAGVVELFRAGIFERDEARERLGLKPLGTSNNPDGDEQRNDERASADAQGVNNNA